jgi:hypothetical protein
MARQHHQQHHNLNSKEAMMHTLILIASLMLAPNVHAGGEVKKVCREDPKTKKEVCRDVKVHKKLEGTKVPPK